MLKIVQYSEQSVALIGETFSIKDEIKKLGGVFNKSLTVDNNRVPGWIFTNSKKTEVEDLIKRTPPEKLKTTYTKSSTSVVSNSGTTLNDIKGSISIDPKITHEMFANLLNKYEMLEARVNFLEEHLNLNKNDTKSKQNLTVKKQSTIKPKAIKKEESSDDDEDNDESEVEIKPKRFLADI
jgi:hypothetical protein